LGSITRVGVTPGGDLSLQAGASGIPGSISQSKFTPTSTPGVGYGVGNQRFSQPNINDKPKDVGIIKRVPNTPIISFNQQKISNVGIGGASFSQPKITSTSAFGNITTEKPKTGIGMGGMHPTKVSTFELAKTVPIPQEIFMKTIPTKPPPILFDEKAKLSGKTLKMVEEERRTQRREYDKSKREAFYNNPIGYAQESYVNFWTGLSKQRKEEPGRFIVGEIVLGGLGSTAATAIASVDFLTSNLTSFGLWGTTRGEREKIIESYTFTYPLYPKYKTEYKTAVAQAESKRKESLNPLVKIFGFESLPIVRTAYRPGEDVFQSELKAQGYDPTIGLSLRRSGNLASDISMFAVSVASERYGSLNIAARNAQFPAMTTTEKFLSTTFEIGKAGGIVEGPGVILSQQIGTFKDVDYRQVALGAGYGYLSAGLIGSVIYTFKSKPVLYGAYASDIIEYPADKFEGFLYGGASSGGSKVLTFSNILTKGSSPTISNTKVNTQSLSNTNINAKSLSNVKVTTISNVLNTTPVSSTTPTNVNSFTNVNSIVNTPTTITSNVFNTTPTDILNVTDIPTNVNTNVNTMTNINTMVTVPFARLPLIPLIPGGAGGFSFGRRSRGSKRATKYAPSLGALLKGTKGKQPSIITGLNTRPIVGIIKKKKRKKKR